MKTFRANSVLVFLAVLVCLCAFCLPTTLLAADTKYSLGAGVGAAPDYEGSDTMTGVPALFFSAMWDEGYFIKLAGPALRANVIPSKTWSLGPVLQYRAERDSVDSGRVSRMTKIDSTAEAGLFVGFAEAGWDVSLQWAKDVSDKHDGSVAKLAGGYTIKEDKYATRIGVSSSYADDDYMDTYFSTTVANNGASEFGKIFKAEAEIKDVGADLTVRYQMNDNWDLMGMLGYKVLLGDAKDSPVTDIAGSSSQGSAAVLAIYNF